MRHSEIEENNIIERHLMGKLSAQEQLGFEEHLNECGQCRDSLKTTDKFRAALRVIAAEAATRPAAGLPATPAVPGSWRRRWHQSALLAAAILLVAAPLAWLIVRWRG